MHSPTRRSLSLTAPAATAALVLLGAWGLAACSDPADRSGGGSRSPGVDASGADGGASPDLGLDGGGGLDPDGGPADGGGPAEDGAAADGATGPDDGGADGGPEPDGGNVVAPEHCGPLGPLPEWASTDAPGFVLQARCDGLRLGLQPLAGGALRLQYLAEGQEDPTRPWAIVERPEAAPAWVGGADGAAVVCSETWRAEVRPGGACRVHVQDAQGTVLLDDGADGGWRLEPLEAAAPGQHAVSLTRVTPEGEPLYGLGEKTGPLDKRGRRYVLWNTDPYDPAHGGYGPGADPIYASIPWLVGMREGQAYGLLTDTPYRLAFDLAVAHPQRYRIDAAGGALDQYLVPGPLPADVLRRYAALTGRPPMPPRWALGFHQCRWGYTADELLETADELRRLELPADVLWLDIQHMDDFRTFTFDPEQYPDPAAFVQQVRNRDFALTVIADPCLYVDPEWDIYAEALAGDHLLRMPDGEVFVGRAWPPQCSFPDFTRPETRAWWAGHVGRLAELGVQGIWLDVNEPTEFEHGTVPEEAIAAGDGRPTTMGEVHNVYALLEAQATREGLLQAAPQRRPWVLSRAGYAGIQRYAAMWTGDVPSTWHGMSESLPMMLNLSLSGVPLVGSDVGGYSGGASPELFARWMALGVISPFFRVHTTRDGPRQEPWRFGTEVLDLSRALLQLRYRLLPALYSLMDDAARTGAPILRPMFYEFPDDPDVLHIQDQALLGPYLLAAPVLAEGALGRQVYLPAGRWFELHSGAAYDGPTTVDVNTTLAALPLYVRAGGVIALGPGHSHDGEYTGTPLELRLYPGLQPTSTTLYEDAGDGMEYASADAFSRATLRLESTPTGASLSVSPSEGTWRPPQRTVITRTWRVDGAVQGATLDDEELPAQPSLDALLAAGRGWWADAADRSLWVAYADRDGYTLTLRYDPAVAEPLADVPVRLDVHVPPGTPRFTDIHVATSANGWDHVPLQWVADEDRATGIVTVPRGQWFFYKFSRGGWESVEKYPGCEEANNRYAFGAAHPVKVDTVWAWRDLCEQ